MFPLSLLPSRGILDPDCALVLRNSCIVSRETAGKTHGTFIFCTHKYRNSSAQALPYLCSRGCFLFLRQPPLQSSIRRSDFAVFRQAFLQKGRPLRAAAPCTVPPTRAVRAAALSFFVRHGKPARARRKARRRGSFHHSGLYLPCPYAPCLSRHCARPPPCPWWRRTRQCHDFLYIIWWRPPVLHVTVSARIVPA